MTSPSGETAAAAAMTPAAKRAKVELTLPLSLSVGETRPLVQCLLPLIIDQRRVVVPTSSSSSSGPAIGNNTHKMKELFDGHGFRTSLVTAPREGLSIYLDSVETAANEEAQNLTQDATAYEYLTAMLGLHPDQNVIEQWYSTTVREAYCLKLFCQHVRSALDGSTNQSKDDIAMLLQAMEDELSNSNANADTEHYADMLVSPKDGTNSPKAVASALSVTVSNLQRLASSAPNRMSILIDQISEADHNLRPDQLQREYEGIRSHNSTYANALMQLFLETHGCTIKEIQLRRSHLPKYERLSIFLYDPSVDEQRPNQFTFLPSLRSIIDDGIGAVVGSMVTSFWNCLLRLGYYATPDMKNGISEELRKYFLHGLTKDSSLPFLLNANFTPRYPLSLYLHGKAGVGKSSLVRFFAPALEKVIEEFCDPEVTVRFVKQNLNKKAQTLERELELRPNNNDASVMSIIQGRRMTLTQQKPGLVVIGLEELASDQAGADPNQLATCQLLSQRFSGRNSNYQEWEGRAQPRNSTKRGISGDASLVALFTSNYELSDHAQEALRRLEMFRNLKVYGTAPLSGGDRVEFARAYVQQCVRDRLGVEKFNLRCEIELDIPIGEGDMRSLIRKLRTISLVIGKMLSEDASVHCRSSSIAKISYGEETESTIVSVGGQRIQLQSGSMGHALYPALDNGTHSYYDHRTGPTMTELQRLSQSVQFASELGHVFDYYFTRTLTPAVVVSNDAKLINYIVESLATQHDVNKISGVDPDDFKMVRSLYDPIETPNLRDDILKFGRGALVVVEILCKSKDAQLLIREMIEDTPSRSAFSSNNSALKKDSLFFAVHVADELTPEILSRASLVL